MTTVFTKGKESQLDPKVKAKGRAVCALRIGLRAARDEFEAQGDHNSAADCQAALDRAEKLEADGEAK